MRHVVSSSCARSRDVLGSSDDAQHPVGCMLRPAHAMRTRGAGSRANWALTPWRVTSTSRARASLLWRQPRVRATVSVRAIVAPTSCRHSPELHVLQAGGWSPSSCYIPYTRLPLAMNCSQPVLGIWGLVSQELAASRCSLATGCVCMVAHCAAQQPPAPPASAATNDSKSSGVSGAAIGPMLPGGPVPGQPEPPGTLLRSPVTACWCMPTSCTRVF